MARVEAGRGIGRSSDAPTGSVAEHPAAIKVSPRSLTRGESRDGARAAGRWTHRPIGVIGMSASWGDREMRHRVAHARSRHNAVSLEGRMGADLSRAWGGETYDINLYPKSPHHIDIQSWSVRAFARPTRAVAMASMKHWRCPGK